MSAYDLNLDKFFFEDDVNINKYMGHESFEMLNSGKMLRAKLTLEFGRIFEIPDEKLLQLARAIEIIHNATLTHDDVIDGSRTRRGTLTVKESIGNKKAVLIGDYMLAKARHELSSLKNTVLMKEISLYLKMLVDGEWQQFNNEIPVQMNLHDYERLAINKSGALFAWCLVAGYALINDNQRDLNLLKKIGYDFGIAFQATDDILDFSAGLDKTPYLDFRNNNPNIVFSLLDDVDIDEQDEIMKKQNFSEISADLNLKFTESFERSRQYLDGVFERIQSNTELFSVTRTLVQQDRISKLFEMLETKIRATLVE